MSYKLEGIALMTLMFCFSVFLLVSSIVFVTIHNKRLELEAKELCLKYLKTDTDIKACLGVKV